MRLIINRINSKFEIRLLLILSVYLILGLILLNYFQYILNSDGISYISIAQKYIAGDWENAINGYWGPLFSWLMVPFLFFSSNSLENLYLVKLLSLIIGFFTIIGVKLLSDKFGIKNGVQTVLLISLIPIMLKFSFFLISPDLLVVCFLLFYLNFIFDENYSSHLKNGILCGTFAGLAFLTKSYALVFFIFHFTIINVYFYLKDTSNRKVITKNFLLGLSVFLVISGVWIGLISEKYGYLTMGTTGKYNYELVGPESGGHAMLYQGLMKPPNDSAISAWEDPSYFKMKSWSALSSWNNFKHQLNLIWGNIVKIINILINYSIFSLLILIVAILFVVKTSSKTSKSKITYLIITILLYLTFYSFILIVYRYLWLICILTMITAVYLINHFYKMNKLTVFSRNVLLTIMLVSFIIGPIPLLAFELNLEKDVYLLSQTLQNDYHINGKIASNENWELTIYLVYCLKGTYYGITLDNNDLNHVNQQLIDNNIEYYLVWNNNRLKFSDYEMIGEIKDWQLQIYKKTY